MARWPWSRKARDTSQLPGKVPEEVEDYYQSAKRERVGVAWLLALGTLIVTVVLAIVIFYGGRWVYRTVFNDNNGQPVVEQGDSNQSGQSPADENKTDNNEGSTQRSDQDNGDGNETESNVQSNGQPSEANNQSDSSQQTGGADTTNEADTPQTGSDAEEVPDTGPGNVLAIVLFTSITGAVAHNLANRAKVRP